MTAPSGGLPTARTLAGWWRQLNSYQPAGLWIGTHLYHNVEALVRRDRPGRLDPLPHFALRALTLTAHRQPAALGEMLGVDRQTISRVLHALQAEGLARPDKSGAWTLTPVGDEARESGAFQGSVEERCRFALVETRGRAHFLATAPPPLGPPEPAAPFQLDWLRELFDRPPDWKRRNGFPEDIRSAAGDPVAGATGKVDWRAVTIDRPTRTMLAFALCKPGAADESLLGFPVHAPEWLLREQEPVIRLGASWPEVFPDLAEDPPISTWHAAWRAWAQPRGLPQPEVSGCSLRRSGYRLHVTAPRRLVERLRAQRSDAFKGETWLLAAKESVHAAALVDIIEAAS